MVQDAARFCERTEFPHELPLKLGATVKTASRLADANGIAVFDSIEDTSLMIELLDALQIPGPMEFIASFELEYNGLRACAA